MTRRIAIIVVMLAAIAGLSSGAVASAKTLNATPDIQTYGCGSLAINVYWNDGGVTKYCGTVGSMQTGFRYAKGLYSGQYWGFATCSDGTQKDFSPGETLGLYCDLTWIGITPPNWT
jgi:hypothetical protein